MRGRDTGDRWDTWCTAPHPVYSLRYGGVGSFTSVTPTSTIATGRNTTRSVLQAVPDTHQTQPEGLMTREEKIAVVESYIHGLGHGDFSQVPFADEVSYESPLTPKRTGQDAIIFL